MMIFIAFLGTEVVSFIASSYISCVLWDKCLVFWDKQGDLLVTKGKWCGQVVCCYISCAWLSLFGGLDSGLDCGTGLWDWTWRINSDDWNDTGNSYTASTYQVCEFFSCNTAVISVRICTWSCSVIIHDPMLTSEESMALIIANKFLYTRCRFEKLRCSFLSYFYAPT